MPDASSHDSFVAWASARGVRVNGIAPAAFAGRRLGLRAQRELKAGETILRVPRSAMVTSDRLPAAFLRVFVEATEKCGGGPCGSGEIGPAMTTAPGASGASGASGAPEMSAHALVAAYLMWLSAADADASEGADGEGEDNSKDDISNEKDGTEDGGGGGGDSITTAAPVPGTRVTAMPRARRHHSPVRPVPLTPTPFIAPLPDLSIAPWRSVWPTPAEMAACIPVLWPQQVTAIQWRKGSLDMGKKKVTNLGRMTENRTRSGVRGVAEWRISAPGCIDDDGPPRGYDLMTGPAPTILAWCDEEDNDKDDGYGSGADGSSWSTLPPALTGIWNTGPCSAAWTSRKERQRHGWGRTRTKKELDEVDAASESTASDVDSNSNTDTDTDDPDTPLLHTQSARLARDWAAVRPGLAQLGLIDRTDGAEDDPVASAAGCLDGYLRRNQPWDSKNEAKAAPFSHICTSSFARFVYFWLVVNTRCMYYAPTRLDGANDEAGRLLRRLIPVAGANVGRRGSGKGGKGTGSDCPLRREDRIAMVPVADYFNHDHDAACQPHFDGAEYKFTVTTRHAPGEEIFVSYGPHTNDFLFAEYGFHLPTNPADAVRLDGPVIASLSANERDALQQAEYYGTYTLAVDGPCYRTQIAAALKVLPRARWWALVGMGDGQDIGTGDHGEDDEDVLERDERVTNVISGWVQTYTEECETVLRVLGRLLVGEDGPGESEAEKQKGQDDDGGSGDGDGHDGNEGRIRMLAARWGQIRALCKGYLKESEREKGGR